jgi:ABC-type transport system involved in multi-copper enzyme maturation permease subunit
MTAVDAPLRTAGHRSGDAPHRHTVPLTRLTLVELRKLADTRAGLWLLVIIGLASVATGAILLFAAPDEEQTFAGFFTFAQLPAGVLLPVLGILAVTSEWSQRTALTTFALVPQRARVMTAKLIAAVLIAVLAFAATAVFGVAGNALAAATGGDGAWNGTWQLFLQCLVLQVLFVLMGTAFGALFLNSPVAIVLYFALPMVWTILGESIRALRTAAGWLDINQTTIPLSELGMTGDQWARLGASVALWVLLPLAIGTVRVLRREVS